MPVKYLIESNMIGAKDANPVWMERQILIQDEQKDSNPEWCRNPQFHRRRMGASGLEGSFLVSCITQSQPAEHSRQTFSSNGRALLCVQLHLPSPPMKSHDVWVKLLRTNHHWDIIWSTRPNISGERFRLSLRAVHCVPVSTRCSGTDSFPSLTQRAKKTCAWFPLTAWNSNHP